MASKSPTARTLDYLRDLGYTVGVVERHNAFSGKKNDLFGFIDLIAIRDGETIGVQATSTGNINARFKKILEEPRSSEWLRAGNKIMVIGFKKYAKAIDRKLWRPTVKWVTEEDYRA